MVGIILIGVSTIYFFRQQQKDKLLEFEAYEIESVEEKVNDLYNEEKTDISEKLSAEQLDAVEDLIHEIKTKEYSRKNKERLEIMEMNFLTAKLMNSYQLDINDLFVEEGIVKEDITLSKVENLEERITRFQEKDIYYDRNSTKLDDAKEQVEDIKVARDFIESLFEGEFVRTDVTRENEEEALKLIEKVKNKEERAQLLKQAETLNLALTEAEEALALEEALAEEAAQQQELEDAEESYESSEDTDWNSNNSGSWNNWGNAGNLWTPPPSLPQETEQPSSQDGTTGNSEETGDSTSEPEDSIPEDPAPEEEESSTEEE